MAAPFGLLGKKAGIGGGGLVGNLLDRNPKGTPATRAADLRNGLTGHGARILDVSKAPGQVF